MNTALWIVQIVLALAFLASGAMKVMKSHGDLIDGGMGYAEDFSASAIKAIGGLEMLAAVGGDVGQSRQRAEEVRLRVSRS